MRTFDIDKFSEAASNGHVEVSKGDSVITLNENKLEYVEIMRRKGEVFETYYAYDKKSLKVIREGMFFSTFPVGLEKHYDNNGNIINEINYDKGYAFSTNQVIDKMLAEYNININDVAHKINVTRSGTKTGKPKYFINFKPDNLGRGRVIEIDGQTGEIIRDFTAQYTET